MSVTTTPRKRQLDEAHDTGQSTFGTDAKISKTEDQKGQASIPQTDVIPSLEHQIRFNEDVVKKQRLLEMIQKRINQMRGEEKPKTTILKLQCQIFEDLPEEDLFNLMFSDSSFEDAAGNVLQSRKLFLSALDISYGMRTVLTVWTGKTLLNKTSHRHYNLDVENAAALCEGYEEQKGNRLARAIHLLFSHYNCSAAKVNSFCSLKIPLKFETSETVVTSCKDYCPDEIPLPFVAFFGPAPSEPIGKIKIDRLELTSHTAPLLGWLRTKTLCVFHTPLWLIQTAQKELKEMIAGIDQIEFTEAYIGCVDKIMEACEASFVFIGSNSYWSDESILSVVKANTDANNNAITRRIKMYCKARSYCQWEELFAPITNSYEDTTTGHNVECKIDMPNCTFQYYGFDYGFVYLVLN